MVDGTVRRIVQGAGAELAVLEAGDRERPTLVFVHGYPDTKELWDDVLVRLAPSFHVVCYDVRGAGQSSAPRGPAAYGLQRLGDDLLAVIADVAPNDAVHLVGHDWGGIQGWEFATESRFAGKLASLTTIAGPSLDQVALSGGSLLRSRSMLELAGAVRRSWYVLLLCAPGGPTFAWRVVLGGGKRWRWLLANVDRVPVDAEYPAPTLVRDALRGSNLYRANIPRRMLRPRHDAVAQAPVQVIVPSGDRFISPRYYERAERSAPQLRRRLVAGSHWVPRTTPDLLARWVTEFVEAVEAGRPADGPAPWQRGGGLAQLRDRLALVTGAGSGIGRAISNSLGARGARLVLVDRDGEAASATAQALPGSVALTCDVGDASAMEQLAATVVAEHGAPQIVVNNAGIAVAGPFLKTRVEDWQRIIDVNLMGVVHGCRLFGQAMVEHGQGGHIVNTASAAAFAPSKTLPAYAATKAAVLMLSECVRAELLPSGIGVTAVCPGFIATNITRAAHYVGHLEGEQERIRDHVSRIYERRNFTPERVADEVVKAIGADRPIAVITPEARLMRALARFAPGVLRRLAGLEALPL